MVKYLMTLVLLVSFIIDSIENGSIIVDVPSGGNVCDCNPAHNLRLRVTQKSIKLSEKYIKSIVFTNRHVINETTDDTDETADDTDETADDTDGTNNDTDGTD